MTDLERILVGCLLALLFFIVWAFFRVKRVIVSEKKSSFGYPLSVLIEASVLDFPSKEARMNWTSNRLSACGGKMDKDRLRTLFKAAAAIHVIRLQQLQSSHPTLPEVGGEYVRSLALRVSTSGNQKAQDFAAKAVEAAKSNEFDDAVTAADMGQLTESELLLAMFRVERDLVEIYEAAFKHGISPLNGL